MKSGLEPKLILVTRPTRLAELVQRFNTLDQARFYVERLGADFSDYVKEDEMYRKALAAAESILHRLGRVQVVDRVYLANFVFGPQDTIVVLGQDGLVANTLKYLQGQPVLGVNPDPARWDGQLLPFGVRDLAKVLPEFFAKGRPQRTVTMAEAQLNNGLSLCAVNDLFIGPRSHGSARYRIEIAGASERHSSSGIIVSTGMGSTGWFKSLMTGAAAVAEVAASLLGQPARSATPVRAHAVPVNGFAWDAPHLYYTVREPFPTQNTGATLVFGRITAQQPLVLTSEMAGHGVIFSDGMEADFLEFNSGARATITLAARHGTLVT